MAKNASKKKNTAETLATISLSVFAIFWGKFKSQHANEYTQLNYTYTYSV